MARARITWLAFASLALSGAILASELEPDPAAKALFDRFKSLQGSWQGSSTAGWNEVSTFEVIARGSVVMGTTAFSDADPDRKMVTMFYLDDDRLVAVHYCEARNQPFLVATRISDNGSEAFFEFDHGGNLSDRNRGHMDTAAFRFLDDDTFWSRWTWLQEGEETWFEDIEYRRLRGGGEEPDGKSS